MSVLDRRLGGDGWAAQLTRFALVGGSSNVLYALSFLVLDAYGTLLANAVGVATSTVLANELHRRRTFRAADRVPWFAAQWEGGALALLGLLISSLALALLHFFFPDVGGLVSIALVIAVSGVVGGLRFIALRGWVFGRRQPLLQQS
ncbi:GtrA family protein [Rhodococcus sp. AG1013]|uniref:GtrA family protein n=1 Tax=unclassified Rhodococcus (in: high G+C Gram-positive bacteria) TaxID=192944 RepID=UPI000E0BB207|nr:GtrA family protein [Rhodococcus sp. AG1013]RDI35591.1 putative flippase GtrA [Rhodococcus sp. AG1013]